MVSNLLVLYLTDSGVERLSSRSLFRSPGKESFSVIARTETRRQAALAEYTCPEVEAVVSLDLHEQNSMGTPMT